MSEFEMMNDGSVRLKLDPSSLAKLTCIDMPCFVRSSESAINMLGGKEQVNTALIHEATPINLQFPGANPLRPVLAGSRITSQGVLLKLVRKKNKSMSSGPHSNLVSMEAVGLITKGIHFPNPADYQFIPASIDHSIYNPERMEVEDEDDVHIVEECSTVLETVPQSFCRVDDFDKRQQYLTFLAASKRKKKSTDMVKGDQKVIRKAAYGDDNMDDETEQQQQQAIETSVKEKKDRKIRNPDAGKTGEIIIKFGQPTPLIHPNGLYPSRWVEAVRVKDERFRGMDFIDLLRRLFAVVPVWKRQQLVDILGLGRRQHLFRECLPYASYSFSNGPFANLWVRYGYDPLQEQSSRCYQLLNCRFAQPFLKEISEKITSQFTARERLLVNHMVDLGKMMFTKAPEVFEHKFIDKGAFARLPVSMFGYMFKHQIAFQIATLTHETVFDFISKLPIATACAEQTGWFTDDSAARFRVFIAQFMQSRAEEFANEITLRNQEKMDVDAAAAAADDDDDDDDAGEDDFEGVEVLEDVKQNTSAKSSGSKHGGTGVDMKEIERQVSFFEFLVQQFNNPDHVAGDDLPLDFTTFHNPGFTTKQQDIAHMIFWMFKYQFLAQSQTEVVSRIFVQKKPVSTKEWTRGSGGGGGNPFLFSSDAAAAAVDSSSVAGIGEEGDVMSTAVTGGSKGKRKFTPVVRPKSQQQLLLLQQQQQQQYQGSETASLPGVVTIPAPATTASHIEDDTYVGKTFATTGKPLTVAGAASGGGHALTIRDLLRTNPTKHVMEDSDSEPDG